MQLCVVETVASNLNATAGFTMVYSVQRKRIARWSMEGFYNERTLIPWPKRGI